MANTTQSAQAMAKFSGESAPQKHYVGKKKKKKQAAFKPVRTGGARHAITSLTSSGNGG
jgi:hypothetical protein